ncbi:hypothetical protein IFM89_034137 [Coptis chinensis]|uniref:Uncharacterized protein n=1 Tax=Coptis chinensis TaxID=261450 RepID=A0A835HZ17_9MAGN|nr:hypothetical protein IFM89_034137 [Coptis chinensis]
MYNKMSGSIPNVIADLPVIDTFLVWNNYFSGPLLQKLGKNSKLKYVDVSTNGFTGSIPPDICAEIYVAIPGDITQASKLEYVNVSNNQYLGGVIPNEIWSMPRLQNFSASSCGISSNLPPFTSYKSIEVIELDMNSLSGTVPESVAKCKALERMSLASNR